MIQALYRWLLVLHPRAFRERFEGEMLLTFEDAVKSEGSILLIFDALQSLVRQWLFRQTLWLYPAALVGALAIVSSLGWARDAVVVRHTPPENNQALVILIAVMAIMAVLFTTIFCVVWARLIQRLRRA